MTRSGFIGPQLSAFPAIRQKKYHKLPTIRNYFMGPKRKNFETKQLKFAWKQVQLERLLGEKRDQPPFQIIGMRRTF
jgi:hypothetical protein